MPSSDQIALAGVLVNGFVTLAAVGVAAYVGLSWKKEHVGKRQTDTLRDAIVASNEVLRATARQMIVTPEQRDEEDYNSVINEFSHKRTLARIDFGEKFESTFQDFLKLTSRWDSIKHRPKDDDYGAERQAIWKERDRLEAVLFGEPAQHARGESG